MVNNYKRKTNRQSWNEEDMKNAIERVAARQLGLNKAAAAYNVPNTTLKRRLAKYDDTKDIDKAIKKMGRFEQVFNSEQERELAVYVKQMESRFFGLTTEDLRRLAYELAEKNELKHDFDRDTKMAGRIWLENFLKRNPDLSLRKPEPTSAARAAGFNQVVVNKFFDLLTDLVTKHKLTPDRIFNVDETGITTVPKSMPRIVGTKEKKQVGLLTSAERGQLVTVEFCMGADGSYMPPLFIFPRKRFKPELMNNAPRGSWALCHESGWIQKEIFTTWFEKFIQVSRASPDNPVLLLLDGHASHTKNLQIIDLGRQHGVHILSLPPHWTHRLQPLDVGFMKPLSTYYTEAANNWIRMNASSGRVITQFQVAELVSQAFQKAATLTTAYNAFQATGIWPINRDVFTEAGFLAAATTDIEISESDVVDPMFQFSTSNSYETRIINDSQPPQSRPETQTASLVTMESPIITHCQPSTSRDESQSCSEKIGETSTIEDSEQSISRNSPQSFSLRNNEIPIADEPSCSKYVTRDKSSSTTTTLSDIRPTTAHNAQSVFLVSPKDIMPFPKTSKTKRTNFKRGKTAIITSSPYKEELETTQKVQAEKIKRKIVLENTREKPKKVNGKGKGKGKRKISKKEKGESSDEDQDAECFYCSHLYSESTEGWVQCPLCLLWAHCTCAGIDDEDEDAAFICEKCTPE